MVSTISELQEKTIFTDSKARTTLYSIINSTTGKYCSVASFEWSHFMIETQVSKVRTTLYSIINSTTGKYCSVTFIFFIIIFLLYVLTKSTNKE